MLPSPRPARSGFTLVEVLIASLLTAAVMAMAMQGFGAAKKAADSTKAKALAAQEAAAGVKEVTEILRRASVVYYSGIPLAAGATGNYTCTFTISPTTGLPVISAGSGIPATFATVPYGAVPAIRYNVSNPTMPFDSIPPVMTVPRTSFRFQIANGVGGFRDSAVFAGAGARLHSADPAFVGANQSDGVFSAPLCYCAEAIMNTNVAVGAPQDSIGSMPIGWNIYVIYLAPMEITTSGDPLLPNPGQVRDLGGDNPAKWPRSTIPFELRLLTIRNVSAAITPAAGLLGNGRQVYGEPGTGNLVVPPVPWDYGPQASNCNYDPIMLADDPLAQALRPAAGYFPFSPPTYVPGLNANPDYSRVNGTGPHTNFGSIGNDPPTQNALTVFNGANTPSDRVLARYIDPDNPNGTFIRFENPYVNQAGVAHPNVAGGNPSLVGQRRYVDTIEGGFQYNPNINLLPRRALISITTRFRNNKQLPFTFSTKSEEVSLETSANYQNGTALRRRRN